MQEIRMTTQHHLHFCLTSFVPKIETGALQNFGINSGPEDRVKGWEQYHVSVTDFCSYVILLPTLNSVFRVEVKAPVR